jgi:hypothetical protein
MEHLAILAMVEQETQEVLGQVEEEAAVELHGLVFLVELNT